VLLGSQCRTQKRRWRITQRRRRTFSSIPPITTIQTCSGTSGTIKAGACQTSPCETRTCETRTCEACAS
jgi:hypothetical protein